MFEYNINTICTVIVMYNEPFNDALFQIVINLFNYVERGAYLVLLFWWIESDSLDG